MVGVPGDREGGAQHDCEKPDKNEREPKRVGQRIKCLLAGQGEDERGRQAHAQKPFAGDWLCGVDPRFWLSRVFHPGKKGQTVK